MLSADVSKSSIPLARLDAALQEFKAVHDELPIQAMQTFLAVAIADPAPYYMERLVDVIGYNSATSSRNVSRFTTSDWKRKPGPGWIKVEIDDEDRRRRILTLTNKGKAAKNRLIKALQP